MADPIPLDRLAENVASLSSEQLQARLDALEAEMKTIRGLLTVARQRERRQRRRDLLAHVGGEGVLNA
jgi:hypothetical protein